MTIVKLSKAVPSNKLSSSAKVTGLKVIIHILALLPVVQIYYLAFTAQISGDVVQRLIHFTGIGAFNLLLITLAVTPVAKRFKQGYLMQVKRLLGLYSFFYGLLHVLNFMLFDLQLDLALFFAEVVKRPYITIGMLAFIALTALAITSISRIKRRMGKRWQALHNVIYLIAILVAVHFYWSVKSELTSPIFYFAITLILLSFRHKKLNALISSVFARKSAP